jgi:hypothetical protein
MWHKKNISLVLSTAIILLLAGWLLLLLVHNQGNKPRTIPDEPTETVSKQLALPLGFSNWILE